MSKIGNYLRAAFSGAKIGLSVMKADYDSNAPTGISMQDVSNMEDYLIGVRTNSGQVVTPEKAKRCSAFLAIMRGISEDVSCLPLPLLKRGPNGDEHATDHNVYTLLNQSPNGVHTALEMREHMIWDMLLHGGFFIQKIEDPENPGQIQSLWPLQAGYVMRRWRELVWTYTDPLTGVSGTFDDSLVWRGTMMAGNGIDGQAISMLAREAIGLLLAAEEQGARLFKQGVQTDLSLTSPDTVTAEQVKQLRSAFMERHAGSGNAFMPILLTGGMTAAKIGLTAQESQYIESRAFQISDIARMLRYPDVLLGSLGKGSKASTYASAEQFFQSYTKHCLNPYAVRIEQSAHRDLLLEKEKKRYFFRHDFEELLRGDTAARYASYATGIASGFVSPAQARRKENMPFVPGLDYFTRPLNTTATAGGDAAAVKPTDVSGLATRPVELYSPTAPVQAAPEILPPAPAPDPLARRVAFLIFEKEQKAIIGQKQDADVFYTHFAAFVEHLTGADAARVCSYLSTRRANLDRFSTESQFTAITALTALCTKDA
jgi:HK97 family phage portal protein